MQYVKDLDALYVHLKDTLLLPNDLSDILRAEWIYTISALDKLMHELIRIGMVNIFSGVRLTTPKFQTFTISIDTYNNIYASVGASVPPPVYWFEQEVVEKHKHLSFQDPDKIADGLSFIWAQPHKWNQIAIAMGMSEINLKTRLKTIVNRRNQMVHEADINPTTGNRNLIDKTDADSVIAFIEHLALEIFNAVK